MIGYEEGYDVLWRSDDEVKRVVMKKKMKGMVMKLQFDAKRRLLASRYVLGDWRH